MEVRYSEDGTVLFLTEVINGEKITKEYPVDEEDRARVKAYVEGVLAETTA